MFLLIGIAVVFGSIVVGFSMHGGQLAVLAQVSELIIIGGAGLGSVLVGSGIGGITGTARSCLALLKGNKFNRACYLELLRLMYDVFVSARKGGFVELERHVEHPEESELFKQYPAFLANHHALDLFADTLKLVSMGGVSAFNLSELMDLDLESMHEESMRSSSILSGLADSMPGFGIVAAVLGVVVTMGAIDGPPEEVGHKVAAALVGTFLGILLAYGVFGPISKATERVAAAEAMYLGCIKHATIAFARGEAPIVCVEFARRNIDPDLRPSFADMEAACKNTPKPEQSPATEAAA